MASTEYRVAVVQQPPVYLDKNATIRRVTELIDEAVAGGARLIAFPETFIPGYPDWIWRVAPTEKPVSGEAFARLQRNAVDLARQDLLPVQDAARRHGVTVVCGLHERDAQFGRSTLYNSVVIIGPNGQILNRHRKLVPTSPERMIWGQGDGSGLRTVDTPSGRVGALICWENYMPLARFALYAQGIEIYVAATWDEGGSWIASMQHIAKEARCWVLGAGSCLRAKDIPADFPSRNVVYPDDGEWINAGDSVIVSPASEIVAGPLHEETGILYADCDPAVARAARRTLDVVGHYSRSDVFQLRVNREPFTAAVFEGASLPQELPENKLGSAV